MIKVLVKTTKDKINYMNISGHAGQAEKGYDLVCAGASCIAFGLLNAINEMGHDGSDAKIVVDQNEIAIEVLKDNEELQTILQVGKYQFLTLEEQYTDYLKVEMTEV